MRWWLNTDHKAFSVDNAAVKGMDFSALDADVWMVQWTDGRGEIERQDVDASANLNGLRESFIDVIPYAPLFQQFLHLAPDLSLDQAKKIQIELVNTIFDSKRQMPFHYPVAAGDYWWDASDGSMAAAILPAVQNATASLGTVITSLNATIAAFSALVVQINQNIIDGVNLGIVNPANNAIATINALFADVNTDMADVGNAVVTYINGTILSSYGGAFNSVNYGLHRLPLSADVNGAAGITSDIAPVPYSFSHVGANPYTVGYISYVAPGSPGASVPAVPTSNVQWIPIGGTAPVTVTPAEQRAIMQGIAARTNQLNLVRNTKNAAINALTVIIDVINFDVTTGWPATPLPPGFAPWQSMASGPGNSMVYVGAGGSSGGGGIPEAPTDGLTYGRQNMTWNPALAKTGDTLDGGSF